MKILLIIFKTLVVLIAALIAYASIKPFSIGGFIIAGGLIGAIFFLSYLGKNRKQLDPFKVLMPFFMIASCYLSVASFYGKFIPDQHSRWGWVEVPIYENFGSAGLSFFFGSLGLCLLFVFLTRR